MTPHAALSRLLAPLTLAAALTATTASADIFIQPQTEADSKDTKIYSSVPAGNFSSNLNLTSMDTGADFRSLVQFNLSSIASVPAASITSARLTLYCSGLGQSGAAAAGGTVSISPMLNDWRENSTDPGTAPLATYNAFFGATPTLSYGAAVASQNVTGAGFVSWDITDLVKSWQNGTTANYGVFIQLTTPGGDVGLADVDSAGPAFAPSLTIVPEPSTTAAMAIGGLTLGLVLRRHRRLGALA